MTYFGVVLGTAARSKLPSSDGQRILVLKSEENTAQTSVRLIQDWSAPPRLQ